MKTIADFLAHFRRQRRWTRTLVAAIPEEHFGWAPAAETFSCGDLVRHLMQAERFWCLLLLKGARGEAVDLFDLGDAVEERLRHFRAPNLRSSRDAEYGASFGECLDRWAETQKRSEMELAGLPDAALHDVEIVHPITGLRAPLWSMLAIMVEHEAHHRGQLSAYLKMLGVEQPAAGIAS